MSRGDIVQEIVTRKQAIELGLKTYFTGKQCVNGHVSERSLSNGGCVLCMRTRASQWAKDNPEVCRERLTKWISENRARKAEVDRNFYRKNREKVLQDVKSWKKNNPEKVRASNINRKALKRQAEGKHTSADLKRIFEMQRGKCAYCKVSIKNGYHVDHIKPLSKGGSNWPKNIQLTCESCNLSKRAKDPIQFSNEIGMLL